MPRTLWPLSAGLVALACPAIAQEAAAPRPDEIVVTAQGRDQPLHDVPLAVSVVSGDALRDSGAADIRGLIQLSPSLLVSSSSSEAGGGAARIRGVGTVGDNAGLESSVATFVDGVYRSRSAIALTELGAVDRIEVLRGPQGTLFGRNASAGLIHVVTARPSFTEAGTAEIGIGNYDQRRYQLGLTGPVTRSLAYRLDGVRVTRDGFVRDVFSGRDVNDRDRWLVRGQLLYAPDDALSIRIIGDYADRDEECCAAPYRAPTDPAAQALLARENALGGQLQTDSFARRAAISPGRDYRSDVRDYGLSAQIDHDLGPAQLTSITAWRDWKWVRGQDGDFGGLDLLVRESDGSAGQHFETFSQELRLRGEAFGGRLDWLVGGYFADERLTLKDNFGYGSQFGGFANCQVAAAAAGVTGVGAAIGQPNCLAPDVRAGLTGGTGPYGAAGPGVLTAIERLATLSNMSPRDRFVQKSRNWALFTHNVIDVTDALSLTLGLRYTNERKRVTADLNGDPTASGVCTGNAAALAPIIAGLPAGDPRRGALSTIVSLSCVVTPIVSADLADRKSEDEFTGTAVLAYRLTPDLLGYASWSRGYKAGGFNLDRAGGITAGATDLSALRFEPEKVDAIEIGAKYDGAGFDLNLAAFYQRFDSFQLATFNGTAFIVENVEGCSALDGGSGADEDASGATGACTGKSRAGVTSKGIEVEATARPIADVTARLAATLADTRYRGDIAGDGGRPLPAALFQLPGSRLSNSSRYVVTGALGWTPPIGGGGLSGLVYADARYQSRLNTGSDLDQEKLQKGFVVVNARIGLRGPGDSWAIELYAQNLLDQDYIQVGFDAPGQGSGTRGGVQQGFYGNASQLYGAFLGEPRTYGVTVRTVF